MKSDMKYLDSTATAEYGYKDDLIVNEMVKSMQDDWLNPSSIYATKVKDKINKCRKNIAYYINAEAEEIIFTSGASESNNMAIRGWADRFLDVNEFVYRPNIITTQIEHKSILELCDSLNLYEFVDYCAVDEHGLVRLNELEDLLKEKKLYPILVSISLANNEIGTCQDIKRISELVHKYRGILHCDATQCLTKIPIDVKDLDVDMMSFSGHKISPVLRGIGFLYKKKDVKIYPLIYGNQEFGLRGGTENTYGIVGLSKALDEYPIDDNKMKDMFDTSYYFMSKLEEIGCKINGHRDKRIPNIISAMLPNGVTGESVMYVLNMSNIYISTSSACNSDSILPSHVLMGIGLTENEAMRTIRISVSKCLSHEEIDTIVDEINKAIQLVRG